MKHHYHSALMNLEEPPAGTEKITGSRIKGGKVPNLPSPILEQPFF